MMNDRRTFFKQLALGIAALSAPTIFIPKLIERPKWKPLSTGWQESDLALYNRLDYYLAKMEIERNPQWINWQNLLESTRWQANMGSVEKFIHPERIGQDFLNDSITI